MCSRVKVFLSILSINALPLGTIKKIKMAMSEGKIKKMKRGGKTSLLS
jgi:hypothetical protein